MSTNHSRCSGRARAHLGRASPGWQQVLQLRSRSTVLSTAEHSTRGVDLVCLQEPTCGKVCQLSPSIPSRKGHSELADHPSCLPEQMILMLRLTCAAAAALVAHAAPSDEQWRLLNSTSKQQCAYGTPNNGCPKGQQ